MHSTNLRKVGGSVMLTVPPALLEVLDLKAGAQVGVAVDDGRLIVQASPKRRYTLAELLAASDYSTPQSSEDQEWVYTPTTGKEIL
jgi:antitoxin ChpS